MLPVDGQSAISALDRQREGSTVRNIARHSSRTAKIGKPPPLWAACSKKGIAERGEALHHSTVNNGFTNKTQIINVW
jgi:hypothetical protein